jgi:regulator of chromosome condensation
MAFSHLTQALVDGKFRAAKVVTGDDICVAISDEGKVRVGGSG